MTYWVANQYYVKAPIFNFYHKECPCNYSRLYATINTKVYLQFQLSNLCLVADLQDQCLIQENRRTLTRIEVDPREAAMFQDKHKNSCSVNNLAGPEKKRKPWIWHNWHQSCALFLSLAWSDITVTNSTAIKRWQTHRPEAPAIVGPGEGLGVCKLTPARTDDHQVTMGQPYHCNLPNIFQMTFKIENKWLLAQKQHWNSAQGEMIHNF